MTAVSTRHGHEMNTRRTAAYAIAAFSLSLAGNVGHVSLTTWNDWPMPWPVVSGKVAIAAIGPALIGAGLELANRRPPAVPGDRPLPVIGTWRDFPVVGYLAMMAIGFALSFDHLRSLSELVGVPGWASWLIPVGIDLAAFSVTLDHAQSKRALDRLDAERLEAEAARARRDARRESRSQGRLSEGSTPRPALAAVTGGSKVDQASDWLRRHGTETPTSTVIAGLGWAGNDGDRKAVQRARRRLRDIAPTPATPTAADSMKGVGA
ncbi:MAG: DUF2637 domain-containing protein [Actinomycetota bacterium]